MTLKIILKGGKGSGNFGHSGRPGMVGGSGSGSGGMVKVDKPEKTLDGYRAYDRRDRKEILWHPPSKWNELGVEDRQVSSTQSVNVSPDHLAEWAGGVQSLWDLEDNAQGDVIDLLGSVRDANQEAFDYYFEFTPNARMPTDSEIREWTIDQDFVD